MQFRYVAPAGAPIALADLVQWRRRLRAADDAAALREDMVRRFGAREVFLTNTGRAGLTLALRALRTLAPDRDEVVLPSYTCYSVAASVVRAGLKVRIVDIDPSTLDYDVEELERAELGRALALVATNLYGHPSDMPALRALTRSQGVFLVDDAAQSMGAVVGGKPSGTWGDVGVYSFDKGKNVSAIEGGVVVAQSPAVAEAIRDQMAGLSDPPRAEQVATAAKLAAYVLLLRPSVYWIVNSIPGSGLGATRYTTEFSLARMPASFAVLGCVMLDRLAEFSEHRRKTAGLWRQAIAAVPGAMFPRSAADALPACLRLPMLEVDGAAKSRTIRALNAAGVGATASYPTALVDIPDLRPHLAGPHTDWPGGRTVAERIITLPTHPFVAERDVRRGAAAMERTRSAMLAPASQRSVS